MHGVQKLKDSASKSISQDENVIFLSGFLFFVARAKIEIKFPGQSHFKHHEWIKTTAISVFFFIFIF